MNRRIPNGLYGGVRGRGLVTRPYSIRAGMFAGRQDVFLLALQIPGGADRLIIANVGFVQED